MKINILVDNNTLIDQYFLGEPAASYYIEIDDKRILFDTGYSEVILKNAEALQIDLSKLTHIVLSHGHNDHSNGLKILSEQMDMSNVDLIAHPHCFNPKYDGTEYIGAPYTEKEIQKKMHYHPSIKPYAISENCIFLGEIPQLNDFEINNPIGKQKIAQKWCDDYVIDDSALVCKSSKGIFIITGCSHRGICNIVEYGIKIGEDHRVLGILGGFHLFETDERLIKTIQYFEQRHIEQLYPCHCVSLKAKAQMINKLNVSEVGSGLEISI
ncbi:MAG TPA: MBL fold metallo-hydrolase [Desulfitobacterium dehalogenans]|uniref:MBL fold metallo-hydrolase n=1 Tax=Desulfitobacterium dehalogenans TaxID=36854 RepID=A0A7C6Z6F9_9FIRM|nr:MBL fold metallo-hydrolase [Desulfitobacterium dehalogenans]